MSTARRSGLLGYIRAGVRVGLASLCMNRSVMTMQTRFGGTAPFASEPVYIIKDGSHFCAAPDCARYRPAAHQFQERGPGTDHIGFRLVDEGRAGPGGEE